ncbi:MAG: NUDIX hydrolase [Woeseiaceae bacterium]|nr:NUDIX hydrolase [Woeseiaceae bacterium]
MSWKRLKSAVVYDNPWITVFDEKVLNPNGGESQYGRIHFKSKAIAIVPLDEDGNTWLVGQNRYTTDEYSWEVPMGGSDAGEDPIYTAKRELKEETGLTAGKLEQIMRLHPSNSITDEEGFVFVATNLEQGETDFDDDENLQVRKLSLVDAIEMVKRNEITDAISVAALLRVVTK